MRWDRTRASPLAQRKPHNSVCFSPALPRSQAHCSCTSSSACCPLPPQLGTCLKKEKPISHPHILTLLQTHSDWVLFYSPLNFCKPATAKPQHSPERNQFNGGKLFFFPLTGHRYHQIEQANETSAGLFCFTNLICLLNALGFRISENPSVCCLLSVTPPSSPYLVAFCGALS